MKIIVLLTLLTTISAKAHIYSYQVLPLAKKVAMENNFEQFFSKLKLAHQQIAKKTKKILKECLGKNQYDSFFYDLPCFEKNEMKFGEMLASIDAPDGDLEFTRWQNYQSINLLEHKIKLATKIVKTVREIRELRKLIDRHNSLDHLLQLFAVEDQFFAYTTQDPGWGGEEYDWHVKDFYRGEGCTLYYRLPDKRHPDSAELTEGFIESCD